MSVSERGKIQGKYVVHKFSDLAAYRRGDYYDRGESPNVLLHEGISILIKKLVGAAGNTYASANSEIGVGDSTASSGVATSTGLLSTTNTLYVGVSSITVATASQQVTWRAVFSSNQANFNWREFTIRNTTTATGDNLNRAVSNQGTKAAGQTWTLDLQLTVS